ncbi:MAG TPA: glycerophosphodiester phosphodiesterase [Nocardioides sp.]|uniref:glycerophosphodiester phosphodiesterase n=1 Tax=Nocardioides sp. TaxID=35761 RepID=UPI002BDF66D7|nr:glycerophosphodiester phosphodiesterase [Nocardioides sp.]HTW13860.1 glycerophosphodiester phosphodiesterase [Nocardioides sp.]
MTLLAVAHRAGNSLAGLHAANELGVDIVECDVHALRGRLEVRHLKTAGPLPFLWDRWELTPAWVPRLGLEEVLRSGRRGALFMLDLKSRRVGVGHAVAELLHARVPVGPVLVCGRFWPSVDHVAAQLPYVRPILSARSRGELVALEHRVDGDGPTPYGVSLHVSLLARPEVAAIRRAVEVLMTWPVNDDDTLEQVVGLGATGIISDEPEVLQRVLAGRDRG